ncbi:squalene synthase HpnC [Desertimonas flava]|uniref:squalene synthase HpnC n=1 Tax=Desertimonas flava TaxID=2064846 RepID=UPI0013C4AE6A|nr:squalene synthase HpnC [Desertimonas flava]
MDPLSDHPGTLPEFDALAAKAGAENFPVALRVLPAAWRADLHASYVYARLVDDVGDEYTGDRLAVLDHIEAELLAATADPTRRTAHAAIAGAADLARRRPAVLGELRKLIDANRRDQVQQRYATFDELRDYCRLSADPVGRIVLEIVDQATDDRRAQSDDVCSALQIIEHLQDVAEDHAAGRVYLPQEDLARFGCTDADLGAATASDAVRRLVAFEADRARALLSSARPLAAGLPWRARLAIAGFAAGGLAALDAIAAAGYDVLGTACRPSTSRIVRHAVPLAMTWRRR